MGNQTLFTVFSFFGCMCLYSCVCMCFKLRITVQYVHNALYNNYELYNIQYIYTDLQALSINVFQVMLSHLLSQKNRVLKKMTRQRF